MKECTRYCTVLRDYIFFSSISYIFRPPRPPLRRLLISLTLRSAIFSFSHFLIARVIRSIFTRVRELSDSTLWRVIMNLRYRAARDVLRVFEEFATVCEIETYAKEEEEKKK